MASGDLAGRTFMITGGNTGIGRATAAGLARRGGRVYLACRSPDKGRAAVADIVAATGNDAVAFLPLDLASLASVRECAERFLALGEPLHVLINNAGVAGRRGRTTDGFELTFGVNHLGHFVLTSLLLPCLEASAPARVVSVASAAHYGAPGIDWEAVQRPTRTITGMREYSVSKLANVLHAQELARRLAGSGVSTYSLHPGVIASDIWRRVPWPARALMKLRMDSPEQGAKTSLYCATSEETARQSGLYYDDCEPEEPAAVATADLASELWRRSSEWTEQGVRA